MRKFLLIALACAPVFLLAQVDRMILIEEWTNASCPPCAAQNPAFNTLLDANEDVVVPLKYQAAFPGFDPMNQQNPTEVSVRGDYYGLSGVPTAWINGALPGPDYAGGAGTWNADYFGGPYGYNQAVIDFAAMMTTPISMTVSHELNEEATEVTMAITITNETDEAFSMEDGRLFVALIEEEIVFPEPPGSTAEVEFTNVMRKMYPDEQGTNLMEIAAGATMTFDFTMDVPDYIYNLNGMNVIAFVQDYATAEVFQSGISTVQLVANSLDAGVGENLTPDPDGLCGVTIEPAVELVNEGAANLTSASVSLLINGSVQETVDVDGIDLATGESITVDFMDVVLTAASSTVTFSVDNANGGSAEDINSSNDVSASSSYASLSDTPIGVGLEEDMEGVANASYPDNTLPTPAAPPAFSFQVYDVMGLTGEAGSPVGGYGESDKSILINFYQWNPGAVGFNDATLTYQKIDLAGQTMPVLMFDRASASWAGDGVSGDGMEILISTDCASTFDVVWSASGADLNTAPASDPFFIPGATDWVTETIDLSAYIGEEVNVQIRAISAWGNNLYLDNINVMNVVGTEELTEVTELTLAPNPVSEIMKVNFDLAETSQLQVDVFNATGQRVQQLGVANYAAGRNQLDIDAAQLANGIYFLRIYNADRELNRRFVVQH